MCWWQPVFLYSISFFLFYRCQFSTTLFDMASTHDTSNVDPIQSHQDSAPSKMELTIHHQFPGFELVPGLYYGDSETSLSPDQRIDVGSTMQTDFNINSIKEESISILMYNLQRKNNDESNETRCTRLVMVWKVDKFKRSHLVLRLIESYKWIFWHKDMVMRVARDFSRSSVSYGSIEDTWLMHDNAVLMTSANITREARCYKIEITISEGSMKDNTQRLLYIDLDE
jgi:hypothetical protein